MVFFQTFLATLLTDNLLITDDKIKWHLLELPHHDAEAAPEDANMLRKILFFYFSTSFCQSNEKKKSNIAVFKAYYWLLILHLLQKEHKRMFSWERGF